MPTTAENREMVGRMVEHAIAIGSTPQIERVSESLFWAAKDYKVNGAGFDQADRTTAMALLRDLAFEAATGKDATIDSHEMGHWLQHLEEFGADGPS